MFTICHYCCLLGASVKTLIGPPAASSHVSEPARVSERRPRRLPVERRAVRGWCDSLIRCLPRGGKHQQGHGSFNTPPRQFTEKQTRVTD